MKMKKLLSLTLLLTLFAGCSIQGRKMYVAGIGVHNQGMDQARMASTYADDFDKAIGSSKKLNRKEQKRACEYADKSHRGFKVSTMTFNQCATDMKVAFDQTNRFAPILGDMINLQNKCNTKAHTSNTFVTKMNKYLEGHCK